WISDQSLQAIAKYLDMSAEELEGIATFYNLIYRRPVGKKVILFCDSVSCWICGCDGIKRIMSKYIFSGINTPSVSEFYRLYKTQLA
ncbi:NAD(P)H-dependent oxidoreductase subunit E, partial [bacterium]|nr:NAD(P)H-dependent oxidoreductase subunit E [bacterium]